MEIYGVASRWTTRTSGMSQALRKQFILPKSRVGSESEIEMARQSWWCQFGASAWSYQSSRPSV